MTTLCLDTFSGLSGDMFLGLLVDLGVELPAIAEELEKLPVEGYTLTSRKEMRQGITGTHVQVDIAEQHHHRTWAGIDRMLAESALEPECRELARRIFHRIGVAEAKVHGVALETVHFHEVGAVDSIVDIVGAAIGLQLLGMPRVLCTPLPLSHGTIRCAHGAMPLPAPATLEILQGLPVVNGKSDKELVTPTGAAIAAEIAEFAPMPDMTLDTVGYGVGTRNLDDRPNLVRGILGRENAPETLDRDRVAVLESHIDDSNPEWLGALMTSLLNAGALDVAYSPLQMKKNRPGTCLTAVVPPAKTTELSRLILQESSAIGVRCHETDRFKLRRQNHRVQTSVGEASVKVILDGNIPLRVTPEYDSCLELAQKSGLPLPEVYHMVERASDKLLTIE